jgi:hypothetical protein
MIERVQDDLGIWPRKLIGDTGYGLAEILAWLVRASLCYVAFPIGLKRLMMVDERQPLALAATAVWWMAVVWLGLASISANVGSGVECSSNSSIAPCSSCSFSSSAQRCWPARS